VKLLLDSHCLLWWLGDLPLSDEAKDAITNPSNTVFVSPASIWELEIKAALGKLSIDADLIGEVAESGMSWLPITALHGRTAARLPMHHRDPFDRMLIAQAQAEECSLITRDGMFGKYEVRLIEA
jgi:PIN domain nuclease of toxin-antitoxin system